MEGWQDIVLAAGSAALAAALLPTIFSDQKPAPSTALLTGSILGVFSGTYLTLDLYFATTTTAISGLFWFVILFQSLRQRHKRQSPPA